jgi:hypothetical protein
MAHRRSNVFRASGSLWRWDLSPKEQSYRAAAACRVVIASAAKQSRRPRLGGAEILTAPRDNSG